MSTRVGRKPQDLTLYGIQTSIVELLAYRDEVQADPDMTPAEIAERLKATDEQIQQFIGRELTKVDGVAHVRRELEKRAEVSKQIAIEEYDRLNARAKRAARELEYFDACIIGALQFRLQATGQKKLEGETSTLKLAKCPPSVDVRQPELVPDEYLVATYTLPLSVWRSIAAVVRHDGQLDLLQDMENALGRATFEPMKNAIKEVLKRTEPCPNEFCSGGIIHLTTATTTTTCEVCNGTGKVSGSVPGCVLVTERVRLVVD